MLYLVWFIVGIFFFCVKVEDFLDLFEVCSFVEFWVVFFLLFEYVFSDSVEVIINFKKIFFFILNFFI